jgi:tRNA-binding protein
MISWQDFEKVEIRIGTIISAQDFPEAKKKAYKLWIDFGSFGVKKSSAQVTDFYRKEDLVGKQVVCVFNFFPKQVANFVSEVLVLGAVQQDGKVILLQTERKAENGLRIA